MNFLFYIGLIINLILISDCAYHYLWGCEVQSIKQDSNYTIISANLLLSSKQQLRVWFTKFVTILYCPKLVYLVVLLQTLYSKL